MQKKTKKIVAREILIVLGIIGVCIIFTIVFRLVVGPEHKAFDKYGGAFGLATELIWIIIKVVYFLRLIYYLIKYFCLLVAWAIRTVRE